MRPLLHSPLLHFVLLGLLLYIGLGLGRSANPVSDPEAFRIAVQADRLQELTQQFSEQMGRGPTEADIERMIGAEVDEEILFREAIARGLLERDGGVQTRLVQKMLFLEGEAEIDEAPLLLTRAVELGLHREDIVVRRILVQKMKLLGSQLGKEQQVSAADVELAYQAQQEDLRAPERIDLIHVFLSRDRRGEETESDAGTALKALRQDSTPPSDALAIGDPFPLGHRLKGRSRHDLERTFGAQFGREVFAAPSGTWSPPISSAYGLHLVYITHREPGAVPPLPAVANRLRLQIEEIRREKNFESLMNDLRSNYSVVTPRPTQDVREAVSEEPG